MKKTFFPFIMSAMALAPVHADEYTGVLVTNGDQKTCYLFQERPTAMFQDVEGVTNVCLYIEGEDDPVISVPLHSGATLSLSYDTWTIVNLNPAGYATFSCKDDAFIATNGVTAYKATVSGETITLTPLEGYIPAGTGVLLYGETAGARVDVPVATSGDAANVEGNDLQATTHSDGTLAELEANSWALGAGNEFLQYTGSAFVHNRAYLVHQQASDAKAMRMIFADSEATRIDNTVGESSARSGKFLENGKIVIVKHGMKYNVAGQAIK